MEHDDVISKFSDEIQEAFKHINCVGRLLTTVTEEEAEKVFLVYLILKLFIGMLFQRSFGSRSRHTLARIAGQADQSRANFMSAVSFWHLLIFNLCFFRFRPKFEISR